MKNQEKVREMKRNWARKHYEELREKGLLPLTKQQRIDKAIEYINKEKYFSVDENCEIIAGYRIEELLEILQGSDKE